MTIQPAAPTPVGNWCHLFTPLRAKWFSNTPDHDFLRGMVQFSPVWPTLQMATAVVPLRAMTFLHTTDHDFLQGMVQSNPAWPLLQMVIVVVRLSAIGFLHTTDHNFLKGKAWPNPSWPLLWMMMVVVRVSAKSLLYPIDHNVLWAGMMVVVWPVAALHGKKPVSRRLDVCYARVQAGMGFAGKRLKSRGRYTLKALGQLMGWVSPTNFWLGRIKSLGVDMCYAQVGSAVLSSSSSFHPANLEGAPSRCTL